MKMTLKDKKLTKNEKDEIEKLLTREDKTIEADLNQIWYLTDLVWNDFGCDNKNPNWENIEKYYSHPVWLLNGLFIETDGESMKHRKSIAEYFRDKKKLKILDYGGGFGTLAKEIAKITLSSRIDIYEPHASKYAYTNVKDFKNIKIVNTLKENYYDILVNTDILEHVEKPIELIANYNKCLKKNGMLISHWNFTPCIKCHLPKHFHFRYTFEKIIPLLGFSGEIINDRYGHYFKKIRQVKPENLEKAFMREKYSKLIYPLNVVEDKIKRIIIIILKKLAMYDLVKRVIRQ